ncbi:MAG: MATE family efflux transporter [Planctomycetaceae bacterium]
MTADRNLPVDNGSDLFGGPLGRTVLVLAWPVLCEQFLGFLVGLYDTWLSGRISEVATGAIGLAAYVGWLASMLFGLVATGTTALVARHWGRGERDVANQVMNRSVAMAAVAGSAVYTLIYVAAPWMAGALEMREQAGRIVVNYLRVDGVGHVATGVTLAAAAALRGAGNMRTPMLVLGLVSVLNVLVSTVLVFGLGPVTSWGIDGIVAGTLVARFAGGGLILAVLARGVSGLKLMGRELRVGGETARRVLRIGGPAAVDGAVTWTGQFMFLMIIARLDAAGRGSAVFAAHIVGVRLEGITYLPAVAWGAAAATLIGQSLGAGREERAVASGHEAARQCGLLSIIIGIVFFVFAPALFGLMHESSAVSQAGALAFRVNALFQVPLALAIIYTASLRGAGDTKFPLLANVTGVFCVRLPLAWWMGIELGGGLLGAWLAMCGDVTVRAVLLMWRYRRGDWVRTKI